jgi:DNA-binding NarL/FixJ family response regulator
MKVAAEVSQFRILIVEDHEQFLQFLDSTVRRLSNVQVVDKVQNGLEAVERAEALQPDLILLDIGLPGLNGIDAAHRIRSLAPDSQIIFVTQENSAETVHEAFSLGASGYVIKSQAARDLPAAIDAVIRGNRFARDGLDRLAQWSKA